MNHGDTCYCACPIVCRHSIENVHIYINAGFILPSLFSLLSSLFSLRLFSLLSSLFSPYRYVAVTLDNGGVVVLDGKLQKVVKAFKHTKKHAQVTDIPQYK